MRSSNHRPLALSLLLLPALAGVSLFGCSGTDGSDGGDTNSATNSRAVQTCIDLCNKEMTCGNVQTSCDVLCREASQAVDPSRCANADTIADAAEACAASPCNQLIACEEKLPHCQVAGIMDAP